MDWRYAEKTDKSLPRAVGDRSEETCRELWNNIPEVYRKGTLLFRFLESNKGGYSEEQHTAVERKR